MAADGRAVHGEADFCASIPGQHVLDAGCGTGRVGVELARRGRTVVGVDNDPDMLVYARQKPEPIEWIHGNLATVDLGRLFDLIVMAGNILNYADPSERADVVANLARHLGQTGHLVIGASLVEGCRFDLVDRWCADAGLRLVEQFSTWDRDRFDDGDYRVAVFALA